MMSRKLLGIIGVVFLLTLTHAYAQGFVAAVNPLTDHIQINETASFELTIKNNFETLQEFRIRNFDYPVWDVTTDPLTYPIIISIEPNESKTVKLVVKPLQPQNLPVGTYSVNLRVDFGTDERLHVSLPVYIISTSALISGYLPNVKSTVTAPETIDPREQLSLKIFLANRNPIAYENLSVTVRSSFISEDLQASLGPIGFGTVPAPESQQTLEIKHTFDPLTPPQKDTVFVEVIYKDRIIDRQNIDYEVKEYVTRQDGPLEKRLLLTTQTIAVTSNNPSHTETISVPTTSFKKLFTSTSPKAKSIRNPDGTYQHVWTVTVGSDNKETVSWTINYRPLIIFMILACILILAYFVFRSPVVIRKEAIGMHRSQGGVSAIKVILRIKNRSRRKLPAVEIIDTIPSIAEIDKEILVGSIKPDKITHQHRHVVNIIWNLPDFEQGEERVLSYKFNSRLSIVGEYTLSMATARLTFGKRHITTNSNRATVS